MRPNWEQIEQAAYERWERRGRIHGFDEADWLAAESDLGFGMNYGVLARHRLDGPRFELPADRPPRCRFCEREAERGSDLVSLVPGLFGGCSLMSGSECPECREAFAAAIDGEFVEFWERLEAIGASIQPGGDAPRPILTAGVLKAMTRVALLLAPEVELGYHGDALEWVSNPETEQDAGALAGTEALVYLPHVPLGWPSVPLVRRLDDEAPHPYTVLFLGSRQVVCEVAVPFCTRDEDRDGEELILPRVSLSVGHGANYRHSRMTTLVFPGAGHAGVVGARLSVGAAG